MRQYLDLLHTIKHTGRFKKDRTGVGCFSIFGAQMRFENIGTNFPLVTSRKLEKSFQNAIIELLWFLSGSTNNNDLVEQGCNIWSLWALKEDDIISLQQEGALGPIYGEQWTKWGENGINQIEELITNLKEKPFSRRHVISAWNPDDLPDETISPEENVKIGKMALAPCHCLFQFHVEEMSTEELNSALAAHTAKTVAFIGSTNDGSAIRKMASAQVLRLGENWRGGEKLFIETKEQLREELLAICKTKGIQPLRLSCQLYQRSCDAPVGLPTNIASYSLLTMMIAQCVKMFPGDFVWTGGDTHIYSNQMEGVNEQLERGNKLYPAPFVAINPAVTDIFSFKKEDFRMFEYRYHPAIIYPIAK